MSERKANCVSLHSFDGRNFRNHVNYLWGKNIRGDTAKRQNPYHNLPVKSQFCLIIRYLLNRFLEKLRHGSRCCFRKKQQHVSFCRTAQPCCGEVFTKVKRLHVGGHDYPASILGLKLWQEKRQTPNYWSLPWYANAMCLSW